MRVKEVNISYDNNNEVVQFKNINYLSTFNFLSILNVLSNHFWSLGGNKEDKDFINYMKESYSNEDIVIEALVNKNNDTYSLSRKYYHSNCAFSDVVSLEYKEHKTANDLLDNSDKSFYYLSKRPLSYEDGDILDKNGSIFPENDLYNSKKELFLSFFIKERLIELKQDDKSKFINEFQKFISTFYFDNLNIKGVGVDFNKDLLSDTSSYTEEMNFEFYITTKSGNKVFFRDLEKENLEFLLLLGEIFIRLFMLSLLKETLEEGITIYDTEGIFISYYHLNQDFEMQLTTRLQNIQFIFPQKPFDLE